MELFIGVSVQMKHFISPQNLIAAHFFIW